ncbi:MAG: hypothetical protein Q9M22_06400 [Mariprofundaceae bacterium]|nr:hypothetical protein [Mariprofundaceae bacterium]
MPLPQNQEYILQLLMPAAEQGLTTGKLKLGAKESPRRQALKQLLHEKSIGNLGSATRARYVLARFFHPQQHAEAWLKEKVSAINGQSTIRLANQTKLLKELPIGSIRQSGRAAADHLVATGGLVRLHFGASIFLLDPTYCRDAGTNAATPQAPKQEDNTRDTTQLMAAYTTLAAQTGFSNVEIYALQQASGWSLAALQAHLLLMCREGKAVLSTGDWSLSSTEVRSAVIEVNGQQRLLVRFKS